MEFEPKVMKEINKIVDDVVKKNRDAIENAKGIDRLQKQVKALEKTVKTMQDEAKKHEKFFGDVVTHLDKSQVNNAKVLQKRIEKLEKRLK